MGVEGNNAENQRVHSWGQSRVEPGLAEVTGVWHGENEDAAEETWLPWQCLSKEGDFLRGKDLHFLQI